jgi:Flp pilus assembly protein protease CpaA
MNTLLFSPALYLLVVSVPLLVMDIRFRRLPNKILLPVFPVWLISSITYAVMFDDWLSSVVLPLAIGIPVFIALIVMNTKGSLGMGDVKLLVAMGLSLSWKSLWVWAIIPATLIAGVVVIVFLVFVLRKENRLPLAPIAFVAYALTIAILFTN